MDRQITAVHHAALPCHTAAGALCRQQSMPVGLLYDPSTFPHHSAPSREWEAHRVGRHRPAGPLTDETARAGTFRRRPDALAVLDRDGDGGNRGGDGPWRLLDDITQKYNPFYLKDVLDKDYNRNAAPPPPPLPAPRAAPLCARRPSPTPRHKNTLQCCAVAGAPSPLFRRRSRRCRCCAWFAAGQRL